MAFFGFDDTAPGPGVLGNTFLDGFWEVRQRCGPVQQLPDQTVGLSNGAVLQPEMLGIEYTGLSMELGTVIQRLQLLGFNTVRLPFTFGNLFAEGLRNYSLPCQHPPLQYVRPCTCWHPGSRQHACMTAKIPCSMYGPVDTGIEAAASMLG